MTTLISDQFAIVHSNVTLFIDNSEVCPICLMNFVDDKNIVVPDCGHSIHMECFITYLSYKLVHCAICNKQVIDTVSGGESDMPGQTYEVDRGIWSEGISDYERIILGDGSGMSPWG